jgi:DNA polymerase-4
MGDWSTIIFHLDMDAFYASIEMRDRPELRGKPVIVGGTGRRGVVATANYEARKFGVHSAMPGFKARERCPHGIFLSPRLDHYSAVSGQLMAILREYSPDVEALSLDEAFIDMTGTERLFGPPEETAERMRRDVKKELQLTASIGVASNKMIAKIASDMNKPDGLTVCPPGDEARFLAPLSIRKIFGVGPKAGDTLEKYGYHRIGDLRDADVGTLQQIIGSQARRLIALANGLDARRVSSGRTRKSLGSERTFRVDVESIDDMLNRLRPLAEEVAAGLRKADLRTSGVRLKVKFADFQTVTRETQTDRPLNDSRAIMRYIEELLRTLNPTSPVRLLGVTASRLVAEGEEGQGMLALGAEPTDPRFEELEKTVDAVRERFGSDVLKRASDGSKKRHNWGPDDEPGEGAT